MELYGDEWGRKGATLSDKTGVASDTCGNSRHGPS